MNARSKYKYIGRLWTETEPEQDGHFDFDGSVRVRTSRTSLPQIKSKSIYPFLLTSNFQIMSAIRHIIAEATSVARITVERGKSW